MGFYRVRRSFITCAYVEGKGYGYTCYNALLYAMEGDNNIREEQLIVNTTAHDEDSPGKWKEPSSEAVLRSCPHHGVYG
jgi:hypothetical protein